MGEKPMTISYGRWEVYPWKNELVTQSERVALHFGELMSDDFKGSHNPLDMLDRAIVLAAFAIRRMFEKRLVTDKLRDEKISIRTYESTEAGDFRRPYKGGSGGQVFLSYNFATASNESLTINDLANEIIHSSQLMFVGGEKSIPGGLLIASDWHLIRRLLHLTIDEFTAVVQRVLDDRVRFTSDGWDPETGKISAARE
jgi:hypothetical protein